VEPVTRESFSEAATLQREEMDGFAEGLLGFESDVDLPHRAHEGMSRLADLRAMFLAVADLMSDPTKPASEKDFKVTRDHLRELTRIAEREINAILLSCKQARRRAAPWWGAKETLH
jgi:hypothetical protein